MKIKHSGSLLIASALCALTLAGIAVAQEDQPRPRQPNVEGQPGQPNQPRRGEVGSDSRGQRAQADASSGDRQIVECLIIENENEIAVARLAQDKASSEEVKGFAEMMIKDH